MPLNTLTIVIYIGNPFHWFLTLIMSQNPDASGCIDHHQLEVGVWGDGEFDITIEWCAYVATLVNKCS